MQYFFIFALLFAACGIALSQSGAGEMRKIALDCAKEFKIEQKTYEDFRDLKLKPADVTENFKCMAKCFLEKNSFMDAATGDFKADAFKTKVLSYGRPAAIVEKAVEDCKDLKGVNACDKAYQILSCLNEKRPKQK